MYSAIVLDCQTKTASLNCEDCIAKKKCANRLQNQRQTKKDDVSIGLAIEILA